jgi:hypothetical protein
MYMGPMMVGVLVLDDMVLGDHRSVPTSSRLGLEGVGLGVVESWLRRIGFWWGVAKKVRIVGTWCMMVRPCSFE